MSDILERAKAALEGITPGPWTAIHAGNIHWGVSHEGYRFGTIVKAQCGYDGFGSGSRETDAKFIAQARSLVPELVAEVEQLRAQVKVARAVVDTWRRTATGPIGEGFIRELDAALAPPVTERVGTEEAEGAS